MKALSLVAVLLLALPAAAAGQRPDLRLGEQLYAANCVSCHGPRGEGMEALGPARGAGGLRGLGPPLRGVGARAADFYLSTGRMPLGNPYAEPERRNPAFSPREIDAIVAYVASLGGGPDVPEPHPERGNVSEGLQLFTESCAGCHQILGEGGIVTGAHVPALVGLPPQQIAEAVRIGPHLMPRFSEQKLSDAQLDSIISYIAYAGDADDRGGWSLGHLGPIPEGMVTWLAAVVVLLGVCAVIGRRLTS